MDPRIEAAIAEIRIDQEQAKKDMDYWSKDPSLYHLCQGKAIACGDAIEILRHHAAKPSPLIAELEELAKRWMDRADRNSLAEKHMAAGALDDCSTELRELIAKHQGAKP